MRIFSKVFLTALIIVGFSSCSAYYRGVQSPASRVEFNKENFEFSEQVSAKATTFRILGIDWASLFNSKTGDFRNTIISPSAHLFVDKTANKAVYKIIQKNPEYDVVFYPSIETTRHSFLFFFSRTDATVKAKLAKIKP